MTTPAHSPLAATVYDAAAPVNAAVRAALERTSLAEVLSGKAGAAAKPVTLDVDATVGDAMEVCARACRGARGSALRARQQELTRLCP
jgi:hypothetical protein